MAGLSDEARSVRQQLSGMGVTIGADDFRDVDGSYAEWFDTLGATVVLVCPDFQVYGAGAVDASEMVVDLGRQSQATSASLVG